jgi:acyl dehydratase
MGYYLEEFEIGRVFQHAIRRTVTETDNVLFSTMTHNPAPLHIDHEYMRTQSEFARPLVNSFFTLGLIVGLSIHETTLGTTVANLGLEEVRFPAPLFVGDTVHVETEVIARRSSRSRPTNGILTLEHRGFNQHDVLIATCRRNVLMLRKTPSRDAGSCAPARTSSARPRSVRRSVRCSRSPRPRPCPISSTSAAS